MARLIIILLAAVIGGVLGHLAVPAAGPYLMAEIAQLRAPKEASPPPPAPQPMEIAESETFTVKPTTLRVTTAVSGTLDPVRQTTVKAQVAAIAGEVSADEGEAVKKGQVLVVLDMADLESALAERQANLEVAKAQLELAARNRAAKVKLAAKGFAATLAVTEVESAYQAAAASVRALEAQVETARKALAKAEIKSPMSGIVAERHVNPGDKVSVDTTLMTIVSLEEMELDAPVPASDIGQVAVGQTVRFTVPGLAGQSFEGVVDRINPVARAGTRAIPVHVRVANPDQVLRGGMFASGDILVLEMKDVLAVPVSAVRRDGEEAYVLKLEHGRVSRQPVVVEGEAAGDLVQVSGLAAGDRVIAVPSIELPPETAIRVSAR